MGVTPSGHLLCSPSNSDTRQIPSIYYGAFKRPFDWPSPFVFLPLSTRPKLDSCSENSWSFHSILLSWNHKRFRFDVFVEPLYKTKLTPHGTDFGTGEWFLRMWRIPSEKWFIGWR